MSQRILITGVSGFIGGEIARRFIGMGSNPVAAIVRSESDLEHMADIRGAMEIYTYDGSTTGLITILRQFQPDLVLHLASLFISEHVSGDVESLVRSNVLFPSQLLEAMVTVGCRRIVNTGTSWQHFNVDEYRPVNLYAATKQAFEDILAYYADAHHISCITLKLFDTYGPNDRRRKLIRLLMDAARSQAEIDLSPGHQVIDLVHSEDVVEAFVVASRRLADHPEPLHEAFFVSGESVSLRELVSLLETVSKRRIWVNWGVRPYRAREVMLPRSATDQGLPGWAPGIALSQGLKELVEDQDGY